VGGASEIDDEHEVRVVAIEAPAHAREVLDREHEPRRELPREERLARAHDRALRDRAVHDDAELGLDALLEIGAEALEATRSLEHLAAALEDGAPGGRELRAATRALEELDPERRLERLHGVGHGRRGPVEPLRGGSEAAEAVDGLEHLELVQREREPHGRAS